MSLRRADMAARYNRLGYPPVTDHSGWLYGVWYCGASYQNQDQAELAVPRRTYYGGYPHGFAKRVLTMLGPCRLLHLCCGAAKLKAAVNVDLLPSASPDIRADVEHLPFGDRTFDAILIDPPYSEEDATRYGVKRLIRPVIVMRECARVLTQGGLLLWLDERYPSFNRESGWSLEGAICIMTGSNRRVRLLAIFRLDGTMQTRLPWGRKCHALDNGFLPLDAGPAAK